ncbi:hypothetical protein AB434_2463 [Heyndrickxia coagulans]|nr:hypothetical protein AB434_2463 [Heyndrickxia coagulans]
MHGKKHLRKCQQEMFFWTYRHLFTMNRGCRYPSLPDIHNATPAQA